MGIDKIETYIYSPIYLYWAIYKIFINNLQQKYEYSVISKSVSSFKSILVLNLILKTHYVVIYLFMIYFAFKCHKW